jgi:hypothetical protein
MPATLREVVGRLIEDGKRSTSGYIVEPEINALAIPLAGGPGGQSYLDANGELWDEFFLCEPRSFSRVEDESRKLLLALLP